MSPDELLAFAGEAAAMADYALLKHDAMRHRANGQVAIAISIEARCDKLFDTLPEYCRW